MEQTLSWGKKVLYLFCNCIFTISLLNGCVNYSPSRGDAATMPPASTMIASNLVTPPSNGSDTPATTPASLAPGVTDHLPAGGDRAIYQAVFDYLGFPEEGKALVIEAQTSVDATNDLDSALRYITEQTEGKIQNETFTSFKNNNKDPKNLVEIFPNQENYFFVQRNDFNGFFLAENGWDQFYKKYPGAQGFITLSSPGINTAGNQSLVYIEIQRNFLSGEGEYLLLEKQVGSWVVTHLVLAWIS